MREHKFIEQVQEAAEVNRLWTPQDPLADFRTSRTWPLCLTCGREVDACDVKNVNSWGMELWAQCSHRGEKDPPDEDYFRIKFPFRIEGDVMQDERYNSILGAALRVFTPFPRKHRE